MARSSEGQKGFQVILIYRQIQTSLTTDFTNRGMADMPTVDAYISLDQNMVPGSAASAASSKCKNHSPHTDLSNQKHWVVAQNCFYFLFIYFFIINLFFMVFNLPTYRITPRTVFNKPCSWSDIC